jgi:hypothetical protein
MLSRPQAVAALGTVVLVLTFIATVGPAAGAVSDAASALWPVGIVGLLVAINVVLGIALWRKPRPQSELEEGRRPRAEDSPALQGLPESASSREKREAAYDAILSTSEAYINAHRGMPDLADAQDVYLPDVEEAEHLVAVANQNFVAARQRVEQHGVEPVLEAVREVETAVNQGAFDRAFQLRRDAMVPAIRSDMNRPKVSF